MMSITFISGIVILGVSFILFTMALGGVSYQHIVELPQWKGAVVQPPNFGKFFKLLMPVSFVALLLAISLLWIESGTAQLWLLIALAGIISTTVFTNRYFVPIHTQLFHEQISVSEREMFANRWRAGNRYRMVLMLITIICFLTAYTLLLIGH